MKWLLRGYWAIAGLALALVAVGLFLPARVRVDSTMRIERPSATVYALLARASTFQEWSPWARVDPDTQYSFDGPALGEGARMLWDSADREVGSGWLAISLARPNERVETAMTYDRWGAARSAFDIEEEGNASILTWRFETSLGMDIIRRYAGLGFPNRIAADQMLALRELKALAESLPAADFSDADISLVDVEPVYVVYASDRVRGDLGAHAEAMEAALNRVRAFMREQDLVSAGDPRVVTLRWEPPLWEFKVSIPYAGTPRAPSIGGAIGFENTWAGPAVHAVHRGPANRASSIYAKVEAFRASHRLEAAAPSWEVLITDRLTTPPSEQVVEIFMPVQP